MTTQELYTKLIAGDITEQKFLYEARRDSRLPFITKFNNFKDTIQILKNKGIISEKAAKESAGKQEVEIISKTIDMVNPYEYSRGMDYELDIVLDAAGNADLDEDKIAKAQKKVLKNLTNNPGYYSQKLIPQTEGESEYEVEVNAKSIEDLKKKQGKIIREHGEEYDRVADVNADSTMLEQEGDIVKYDGEDYEVVRRYGDRIYIRRAEPSAILGKLDDFWVKPEDIKEHGEEYDRVADVNADSSPLEEEFSEFKSYDDIIGGIIVRFKALEKFVKENEPSAMDDLKKVIDAFFDFDEYISYYSQNKLEEHGQYADRVADVNADSSPISEDDIEELGQTRESIYEKYAKKYGVDVNELKDRVEALKLEKEAIEVGDEDTAIAVQKKSPDADVRIVKK